MNGSWQVKRGCFGWEGPIGIMGSFPHGEVQQEGAAGGPCRVPSKAEGKTSKKQSIEST